MSTASEPWPTFESPTLRAVVDAFKRRSKGVRYQAQRVECTRELDESNGDVFERFSLVLESWSRVRIDLSIWADGEMSLGVVQPKPGKRGWRFTMSFHGSIEPITPEEIVETFKATCFHVSGEPRTETVEAEVRELWSAVDPYED